MLNNLDYLMAKSKDAIAKSKDARRSIEAMGEQHRQGFGALKQNFSQNFGAFPQAPQAPTMKNVTPSPAAPPLGFKAPPPTAASFGTKMKGFLRSGIKPGLAIGAGVGLGFAANHFLSNRKKTAADEGQYYYPAQYQQPEDNGLRNKAIGVAGVSGAGAAINALRANAHNGKTEAYGALIGKAKELGLNHAINGTKAVPIPLSMAAKRGAIGGVAGLAGIAGAKMLYDKLNKNQY